jgi:protein O-GlcNAc transferase
MAKLDYVPKLLQRGYTAQQQGNLAEARHCYERVLKAEPHNVDATHLLGILKGQEGDNIGALRLLEAAAKRIPTGPIGAVILSNLGRVQHASGRSREALATFEHATTIDSKYPEAWLNRGVALAAMGRYGEAIDAYDRVASLTHKHDVVVWYNRGKALAQLNLPADAISNYRQALQLDSNFADAHFQLGLTLLRTGTDRDLAIASLDRTIALEPRLAAARLVRCLAELPMLYGDETEIELRRTAYAKQLERFAGEVSGDLDTVDVCPFYLAYQGQDDRELQQRFGGVLCRLLAKHTPPMERIAAPADPGEQIRVGIVSTHFFMHTVWKILIKGWLSQLDRKRFRITCYMTSATADSETDRARLLCDRFVAGPLPIAKWREEILADRPHVLLYPEVGMDPTTEHLAALRLAPAQCVSWGHPVTTGLPTMDYFLSSERMEPPNGDEHYTERLVRLPNLSVYYEPMGIPAMSMTRQEIGLKPDACVYWCGQSLFKYLPQHDEVFPRIAREVAGCQFVFIDLRTSQRAKFRVRLERAFSTHGLRVEDHCMILDRLSAAQFGAVLGLSDVYLDSIGWSGGNTTLESLEHDLPIVTLAGPFMRGRHTFAIVKQMGLEEAVAGTIDEYVELAIRLGNDPIARAAMRSKVSERKKLVYRDTSAIRALEDFLEQVARRPQVMASQPDRK